VTEDPPEKTEKEEVGSGGKEVQPRNCGGPPEVGSEAWGTRVQGGGG